MAKTKFSIDQELLAEFIDEAEEALFSIDALFVELEREPSNLEIVNKIFRPIHSIKGNSAFFGLLKVKMLAHELENLLDLIRKGNLAVTTAVIDVLLTGVDELKTMMQCVREGKKEVEDEAKLETFVGEIKAAAVGGKLDREKLAAEIMKNCGVLGKELPEGAEDCRHIISEISVGLKTLFSETDLPSQDALEIPEPIVEIENMLVAEIDKTLAQEKSESVLRALVAVKETVSGDNAELIEDTIHTYHVMTETVGFDSLLRELILDNIGQFKKNLSQSEAVHAKSSPAAPKMRNAAKEEASRGTAAAKTMRVAEKTIDEFLSYVGELVTVGEMFNYLESRMYANEDIMLVARDLRRAVEFFDNLSADLQKSIMEIRKIPVKGAVQKIPRIVRDVALEKGKEVDVRISGGDVSIDKSLIEVLEAPLVHMARNAADHGIELPEERERAGKPRRGTLMVTVAETEDDLIITLRDDGAGLDAGTLKEKAVSSGILKGEQAQRLSNAEAYQLIFGAGFSLAKEVSDISGRGVGMDVVKRNVTQAGGRVEIQSEPGQWTEFTLQVPKSVSVQIIEGFVIATGGERFIIPANCIHESFRPEPGDISQISGEGEVVMRRGNLLPVLRLNRLFGMETGAQELWDGIIVSITSNNRMLGIAIDDIIGLQQAVLKEVDGLEGYSNLFSGGAVLGDGRVSMVVDTEALIRISGMLEEATA